MYYNINDGVVMISQSTVIKGNDKILTSKCNLLIMVTMNFTKDCLFFNTSIGDKSISENEHHVLTL